ncbi:MAG: hypothetical protein LBN74_05905, partial [Prevotella sp.]|nr:hypothetical protein [Prevotella sp.]
AGTAALSQFPLIFAALAGFVPSFHICLGNMDQVSLAEINRVLMANIVPLVIMGFISFLFIAWSIVLKYNAYSVSGNIKGIVGVVSFAIALFISEILSKILIYFVAPLLH